MQNKLKKQLFSLMLVLFVSFVFCPMTVWCSSSPATSEQFVRKIVEAYANCDTGDLESLYQINQLRGTGVELELELFNAMDAAEVKIKGIETLFQESGYSFLGVRMDLYTEKNGVVPYYEYFLVYEEMKGNFQAIADEDYPGWIMQRLDGSREKWEQSELFLDYREKEAVYMGENATYYDELYERVLFAIRGMPEHVKRNFYMLGQILGMAIAELLALVIWSWWLEEVYRNRVDLPGGSKAKFKRKRDA